MEIQTLPGTQLPDDRTHLGFTRKERHSCGLTSIVISILLGLISWLVIHSCYSHSATNKKVVLGIPEGCSPGQIIGGIILAVLGGGIFVNGVRMLSYKEWLENHDDSNVWLLN